MKKLQRGKSHVPGVCLCWCAVCEITVNNNWPFHAFYPGWQPRRWGQPVNIRDGPRTSATVSKLAQAHTQPCQVPCQPAQRRGRVGQAGCRGLEESGRPPGQAKDLGLCSKHTGNSMECFKQGGGRISFVFQKAHSGCLLEKGLNEIIHLKAFAQRLDCSKCPGNTIQLLLFIC